jgi:hypothetical protein
MWKYKSIKLYKNFKFRENVLTYSCLSIIPLTLHITLVSSFSLLFSGGPVSFCIEDLLALL